MEGCVLATIICFIINPLDFLYLLFQINNNQIGSRISAFLRLQLNMQQQGKRSNIHLLPFSSLTSLLNQFMLILMQDIHSELLEYMCVSLQRI